MNVPELGVVGAGRVGAPLAVSLAMSGTCVVAFDRDATLIDAWSSGNAPFRESGVETALAQAQATGMLRFTGERAQLAGVPILIIAVGTPSMAGNADASEAIWDAIEPFIPLLPSDACIIVRSTVPPGCIAWLDRQIATRAPSFFLAYAPERVAEGNAFSERAVIPQIVSGTSPEATRRARAVLADLGAPIVEMEPAEAEYAKLLCNAHRYLEFAVANALAGIVHEAGLNYDTIMTKARDRYPRLAAASRAGFAAGPCLPKDIRMLLTAHPDSFVLGKAALAVNEGAPAALVARLRTQMNLAGRRIGILGMAFKAGTDDVRGSLSYRLADALRAEDADVRCSDEYARDPGFITKDELVAESEIIIVAVPHAAYAGLPIPGDRIVVDTCGGLAPR
jgi:UDP-N-acetyl-D-mannosaminuronic acid dehydrogenase